MKSIRIALAAAGAMILGGCASAPTSPAPSPTLAKAQPEAPTHCIRDTGSRIDKKDACAPGRVYTGEQIRNTGALNTGEALEQLGL
jgi:hypothetical protein